MPRSSRGVRRSAGPATPAATAGRAGTSAAAVAQGGRRRGTATSKVGSGKWPPQRPRTQPGKKHAPKLKRHQGAAGANGPPHACLAPPFEKGLHLARQRRLSRRRAGWAIARSRSGRAHRRTSPPPQRTACGASGRLHSQNRESTAGRMAGFQVAAVARHPCTANHACSPIECRSLRQAGRGLSPEAASDAGRTLILRSFPPSASRHAAFVSGQLTRRGILACSLARQLRACGRAGGWLDLWPAAAFVALRYAPGKQARSGGGANDATPTAWLASGHLAHSVRLPTRCGFSTLTARNCLGRLPIGRNAFELVRSRCIRLPSCPAAWPRMRSASAECFYVAAAMARSRHGHDRPPRSGLLGAAARPSSQLLGVWPAPAAGVIARTAWAMGRGLGALLSFQ